ETLLELLASHMETGSPDGLASSWNLRPSGHVPPPSGRHLVKRKKTEQANICLGTNGLARSDPDRFAFLIVNTAIGGGMSSRLFQEVREKRGLAYSVYSYHSQFTEAGMFTAYAGTPPGRAKDVIGLLRAELEGVAHGGVGSDE